MYNLLVTAEAKRWEKSAYEYEVNRFLEFTDTETTERFQSLDSNAIKDLLSYPCLFAYETFLKKGARVGWLKDIKSRVQFVRIDFAIDNDIPPIRPSKILKIQMELGIKSDWEMNRTHWAVKDVDLFRELSNADVRRKSGSQLEKSPLVKTVPMDILREFGISQIQAELEKAHERLQSDPAGAITSARTTLETVFKHVLDGRKVSYSDRDDIEGLYAKVRESLDISPSRTTNDAFRKIFSGCISVVSGVGNLRSKLGDAHGKGEKSVVPELRHARLAVNLASSLSTYVLETYENMSPGSKR